MGLRALILLLLSLALPLLGRAEPRFGPEVEFRGQSQIPGAICKGVNLGILGGVAVVGVGSIAAEAVFLFREEGEEPFIRDALLATAPFTAICLAVEAADAGIGRHYQRKIAAQFAERARKGELKLDWIREGTLRRRALVVTYPEGGKITFGQDPNVIEVKLSPISAREMADRQAFLQKELFDVARGAGLKVPRADGPWNGGHIHIGIESAFESDPRKLKNFILDFVEHEELSRGVLGKDFLNGRPLSFSVDGKKLQAVTALLEEMERKGEKVTPERLDQLLKKGPFGKFRALNLNTKFGTLEIRSLRSYQDASQLRATIELLDARIRHTNGLPSKTLQTGVRAGIDKASAFRAYVEEAGLKYEDYSFLAPEKYRIPCATHFRWFGR